MSAAPPPAAIPGASQYASAEVMANNAYNAALAQLNQNRLNTLSSYGYTGNVDPTTGVLSGVTVDPHALHGQLQDLLHNQALEDMQAQTAAQNRGVFGGLANQGLAEAHFQHGSQDTALGSNLQQQLADFQNQQQSAAETRDNALWQAEQNAADQAAADQQSQTIDQLIQSLGDPQAAQADAKPATGSTGSSGGSAAPPPPKGGRAGKPGKNVGSGNHRARARRRILRGGGGGRPARYA